MAVTKNPKLLITKLKKQVRILQKREEKTRQKLKHEQQKVRKLGKSFKAKLAIKMRLIKGQVAEKQASTYARVAANIQKYLLKGIEAKAKSLNTAINKLEKEQLSKISQQFKKSQTASRKKKLPLRSKR